MSRSMSCPRCFFEALSRSHDLGVEMAFEGQQHPRHTKPQNAQRRYNCLARIVDDAIVAERGKANREEQHRRTAELLNSAGHLPRNPQRLRHKRRPYFRLRVKVRGMEMA